MGKCNNVNSDFIKRLESEGKLIKFNNDSKIVFISDVHRGDGGYADSLRLNENIYKAALLYYYRHDYTLIELGDGDELWKNKKCLEIAYNYSDIFELLSKFNEKNRLYLVYGNHDVVKSKHNFIEKQGKVCDNIVKGFGHEMIELYKQVDFYESVVLKYTPLDKNIIAFHGHQVDFINCQLWKVSRFLVRYIWRFMEGVAGFKAPTSPAINYGKGSKIDDILERTANKEKRMIICGHTHNDRMPKPGKGLYFNDGCCVFPSAITSIEIQHGEISLVKWKIEVDGNDSLYIKKNTIGGPEKIEQYLEFAQRL